MALDFGNMSAVHRHLFFFSFISDFRWYYWHLQSIVGYRPSANKFDAILLFRLLIIYLAANGRYNKKKTAMACKLFSISTVVCMKRMHDTNARVCVYRRTNGRNNRFLVSQSTQKNKLLAAILIFLFVH